MRPSKLAPVVAAVLAFAAPAQDGRPVQAPDGRILDPDTSAADTELTALTGLLLLTEGTTLAAGRDRDVLRDIVRGLVGAADDRGRIGLAPEPGWLSDHALATAFLAEVATGSDDAKLRSAIANAVDALVAGLELPGLVDAETLWWTAWCVDAARRSGCLADEPDRHRVDALAKALRTALVALPEPAAPAERGLLAHLRGEAVELIAIVEAPAPQRFFAACHAFAVGGQPWRAFGQAVQAAPGLVPTMRTGAWNVDRAYDALTLMLWYRYAQLPAVFGTRGMLAAR